MKEAMSQVTVDVGIDSLWKCFVQGCTLHSSTDRAKNLVHTAEVVEGDGVLGSVFLFCFAPGESPLYFVLLSSKSGSLVPTMKEATTQVTVDVGIDSLWKCLSRDVHSILPQIVPNLVQTAEVVEGDGGLGSVFLFCFAPDVPVTNQKEKIVELDESSHRIGFQVIEGGHLDLGFTFYCTSFQLTTISEKQTLVDVMVTYECETEEIVLPSKTKASALAFIKCLENHLLSKDTK